MLTSTTVEELRDTIKTNKCVVVDFFTNTCIPCKIIEPVIESLSTEERFKEVKFVRCNAHDNDVTEWAIRAVPTVICFKDGIETKRQLGLCSQKALADMFDTML